MCQKWNRDGVDGGGRMGIVEGLVNSMVQFNNAFIGREPDASDHVQVEGTGNGPSVSLRRTSNLGVAACI